MSIVKNIRRTAEIVSNVGNFCLNPLCLHVAGKAKCKKKCCK